MINKQIPQFKTKTAAQILYHFSTVVFHSLSGESVTEKFVTKLSARPQDYEAEQNLYHKIKIKLK